MGPTRWTFPLVLFVLGLQISLALYLRRFPTFSWPVMLIAYVVGGTANQNIFLAIHEITHNLAFKSIRANKALAILANFSIGIPYAMAFKGYHIEHHKFLGEDGIDTDIPSRAEAMILNNVAGKTFFATFQLLFYALRPGFIRSQKPTKWHAINLVSVLTFDAVLVHFFGWRPFLYLIASSFFAGSLHPCAAHFIAEHYLMNPTEPGSVQSLAQETTSYYGWLNIFCYNVSLQRRGITAARRNAHTRSATTTSTTTSPLCRGRACPSSAPSHPSTTTRCPRTSRGPTSRGSSSPTRASACGRALSGRARARASTSTSGAGCGRSRRTRARRATASATRRSSARWTRRSRSGMRVTAASSVCACGVVCVRRGEGWRRGGR